MKRILLFFVLLLPPFLFPRTNSDSLLLIQNLSRRFPLNNTFPLESISLCFVGDLQMGGSCLPVIIRKGSNYPFDSTRSLIHSADLAIANLEAPFVLQNKPFNKKFTFRVPPEYAAGLVNAGFDMLTLANNHILDHGLEGLALTLQTLDSMKIQYCGAGMNVAEAEKPCLVNVNGWTIGFLAFSLTYPATFWARKDSPGTAYPNLERIKSHIKEIRENCDLIVVAFHWGGELRINPKPYQKYYAHAVIDLGADIVVGHHPHVLQGIELYKGKFIAYSLGNYVFGSYSRKVSYSMILKLRYDHRGLLFARIIPIDVYNPRVQFRPTVIKGNKLKSITEKLNTLSLPLNNQKKIIRDSGLIIYPE